MNYTMQLINHIQVTESEDFWHAIESGDLDDYITSEDRELIVKQSLSDDCILDITVMKKLAKVHIYAVAYLAGVQS